MSVEEELIKCNKEFAEIVKRQQAALEAVSLVKFDEPRMLGHLRDAVYAFYRPYLERNSIEQALLEKLLAAQRQNVTRYYMNLTDMQWFEKPERPKPPVFQPHPTHPQVLVAPSQTICPIQPDGETVQLTEEQYEIWRKV